MENLVVRLLIEDDNRKGDKVSYKFVAKANIVEAPRPQPKKQQAKKKNVNLGPRNNAFNKRI